VLQLQAATAAAWTECTKKLSAISRQLSVRSKALLARAGLFAWVARTLLSAYRSYSDSCGESCAGSDYILLPLRATLAKAILSLWSGAITGLDGARGKLAACFANFLIAIC
jgi:hypothetical protein